MLFLYAFTGQKYFNEFEASKHSLTRSQGKFDVHVVTTEPFNRRCLLSTGVVTTSVASGMGFEFKVNAIAGSGFRRFIFLDTDTTVWSDLTELWRLTEIAGLCGVAEPLRDSFVAVKDLKRPPAWQALGIPELNTGVLAFNLDLLPNDFLSTWRDSHNELIEENVGHMAAGNVPDQPSLQNALTVKRVAPLILGAEYNFRPYYPQVLNCAPKVTHCHMSDRVAFKDRPLPISDLTVTFPWGGYIRRGSVLNRVLFLFFRFFARVKSIVGTSA